MITFFCKMVQFEEIGIFWQKYFNDKIITSSIIYYISMIKFPAQWPNCAGKWPVILF